MADDKVALVTGANRGIGFAICKELLKDGYTVVLTSRDPDKGKEALKKLDQYDRIHYQQLDVTEPESIARAEKYVRGTFGRLDALFNNAGINYDSDEQPESVSMDDVRRTLDVNLLGPWRVSQAFVPLMKENNYGRIINISSGSGQLSGMSARVPAYGVSKAALNALTIKLGKSLDDTGIKVNAVDPGWVRTDMGGQGANRSPEESARSFLWLAEIPEEGPTGGFFKDHERKQW